MTIFFLKYPGGYQMLFKTTWSFKQRLLNVALIRMDVIRPDYLNSEMQSITIDISNIHATEVVSIMVMP